MKLFVSYFQEHTRFTYRNPVQFRKNFVWETVLKNAQDKFLNFRFPFRLPRDTFPQDLFITSTQQSLTDYTGTEKFSLFNRTMHSNKWIYLTYSNF